VEEYMPYLFMIVAISTEFAVICMLVVGITWFHTIFFQIFVYVLCAHVTIPEKTRMLKLGVSTRLIIVNLSSRAFNDGIWSDPKWIAPIAFPRYLALRWRYFVCFTKLFHVLEHVVRQDVSTGMTRELPDAFNQ
jgi:hypothetical protein